MAVAEAIKLRWIPVDNDEYEQIVEDICSRVDDPTEAACQIIAECKETPALWRRMLLPLALLGARQSVYDHQETCRKASLHEPSECGRPPAAEMAALRTVNTNLLETVYGGKPLGDHTRDELSDNAVRFRGWARGHGIVARWHALLAERCKVGKSLRDCIAESEVRALRQRAEEEIE